LSAGVTFGARELGERHLPLFVDELARDLGRPRAFVLSTRDEGCTKTLPGVLICLLLEFVTGICMSACELWLKDLVTWNAMTAHGLCADARRLSVRRGTYT